MAALVFFALCAASTASALMTQIFVSQAPYCFRIPTMVETPGGTLLAFAEMRGSNCGDDGGGHNLVMRPSTDGGATWGPMVTVVGNASNLGPGGTGFTNPNPTVVTAADGSYRILLQFATLNNPCPSKHGLTMQQWSSDDGQTWGAAADITGELLSSFAGALPGPTAGVQDASGRIFMCAWGNNATTCNFPSSYSHGFGAFVYYSVDAGKSWTPLDPLVTPNATANECSLAVGSDGSVLVMLRQVGGPILRTTYAADLASRTPLEPVPYLSTPVCEGSLAEHGGVFYYSNPSSAHARVNNSVHASRDGGATWPAAVVYNPAPAGGGYSALVARQAGLAVAFEVFSTQGINFTTLPYF